MMQGVILSQSLGKCEPELDAENDIAASAATKSTLRVDDICGDAADDILIAFGLVGQDFVRATPGYRSLWCIGINDCMQREKIISLLFL